jgi:broad specificity phosphatase PhoE
MPRDHLPSATNYIQWNDEENTMKIFLLGHGEALDGVEDAYGGIADFSLTDNGINTAYELGHKLESSGIEMLYNSPFNRAEATAGTLAAMLGLPMRTIDDLRDRNSYGVLSGVNKAKAQELFRSVLSSLAAEPGDYYSEELVTGAEPVTEFDARVKNAFENIVQDANQYSVIGIVTHKDVIRSIYKNILGMSGKIDLDPSVIILINYIPVSASIESKEGVQVQV